MIERMQNAWLEFNVRISSAGGVAPGAWVTFEAALAALEKLPRMFIEPDGSFVWVGESALEAAAPGDRWQLDGVLFDGGAALAWVEVYGRCDEPALAQLLACLDWPATVLEFEERTTGRIRTELEFRAAARPH